VILCALALALALFWWLMMSLERYGTHFRRAGSAIQGHLLEVLLYGAFPRVMLRSLWSVTRASAGLSWALLAPSLWFCLPLFPALILAAGLYSQRPVQAGEPVLVWLKGKAAAEWTLEPSSAFEVEVDGFTLPDGSARTWRLRARQAGRTELTFRQGAQKLEKSLQVGGGLKLLSDRRVAGGLSWLGAPLESPLPASAGVSEIRVDYPPRELAWRGWSAPWWVLLLLAFLAWSWLLALLPAPGNRKLRKQRSSP
jgi:hypothetical protein